jgi:hypothetical protein
MQSGKTAKTHNCYTDKTGAQLAVRGACFAETIKWQGGNLPASHLLYCRLSCFSCPDPDDLLQV